MSAEVSERNRFIDCGENLERIACPNCAREIEITFWQEWMDREAEEDFPLNVVALPCCGTKKNLAELEYDWPQGFSRFSIEAMNPNIADLTAETVKQFELVLGCKLRKVLQRL